MPKKKKEIMDKEEVAEKKHSKKTDSQADVKLAEQPVINIGLIGHVDHGKTTLTERLSGKWTDTHSEEIKRGITIRLGYANTILRKCPKCTGVKAYTVKETCSHCNSKSIPLRKISFVDAPGHESLMATMLAGATIMDAALLLIGANEECPQPQTQEHLMALEIMGVKNIIIVQNKIDLVSDEQAIKNYEQIKKFIEQTPYKDAPIIPISAQYNVNIDALLEAIEKYFPTPKRDDSLEPMMFVARSFDVNKPGTEIESLSGGVLGGSLKQGKLKVGDEIELRPGYMTEEKNKKVWKPITTKIIALETGNAKVNEVKPGGSIGVLTELDPSIVKSDSLTGNVVGLKGKLPNVYYTIKLEVKLLQRIVGTKKEDIVEPIKMSETLMLNINSAATVGIVTGMSKNIIDCTLKLPICAEKGARITISRIISGKFRLIGYGILI